MQATTLQIANTDMKMVKLLFSFTKPLFLFPLLICWQIGFKIWTTELISIAIVAEYELKYLKRNKTNFSKTSTVIYSGNTEIIIAV